MRKFFAIVIIAIACVGLCEAKNPPSQLLERLQKGASRGFIFEISDADAPEDFFEISQKGAKVKIEGNSWLSVAVGLRHYLGEVAGIYVGQNTRSITLPSKFPVVVAPDGSKTIRRTTTLFNRYKGNVLSQSYSTAFWNTQQWRHYVDYLALCGVTMPLVGVGVSEVWGEALLATGVSRDSVQRVIPHPAFEGLWLGAKQGIKGFTTPEMVSVRGDLGAQVVEMCREWGMSPVLLGYNKELYPEGTKATQAEYYKALTKKYGEAEYYYVPAPTGGSVEEAKEILDGISTANSHGCWVVGVWEGELTTAMIDYLPRGRVMIIDSWGEVAPQWGDKNSVWYRKDGFVGHDWVYGIAGNFSSARGMYGALSRMIGGFYLAQQSGASLSMVGVASQSAVLSENDVVQDLLFDLPWVRYSEFKLAEWMKRYVTLRYGQENEMAQQAWQVLQNTLYAAPRDTIQRGTNESVFVATPALQVPRVSPEGITKPYYDPQEVELALEMMFKSELWGNDDFDRDATDVAYTALSNYGYELLGEYQRAFDTGDKEIMEQKSNIFLEAMLLADNLLNSHSENMAGEWINSAMALGANQWQREWMRAGAKELILQQNMALGGVMERLYATRWASFFQYVEENESLPLGEDYSAIAEEWMVDDYVYPIRATSSLRECVEDIIAFLKESRVE